jgi:hypothetical protein
MRKATAFDSGLRRNDGKGERQRRWIPACAGTTAKVTGNGAGFQPAPERRQRHLRHAGDVTC